MKKSLVALAILGTFTGVASAATSVTLYGNVELDYGARHVSGDFDNSAHPLYATGQAIKAKVNQFGSRGSNFGITGTEDLGNGLAATFRLESAVAADDGQINATRMFHRESTVGLKGAFGHVRLGRAKSQMELMQTGISIAHGVADSDLYAIAQTRHSNGLFYDYDKNGFTFGADVTTKGGGYGNEYKVANVITAGENQPFYQGGKINYGVRLGYAGHGFIARVGYQNDDLEMGPVAGPSSINKQREFGAGLMYNFMEQFKFPLALGAAYATGEGNAVVLGTAGAAAKKSKVLTFTARSGFSPSDLVYVTYQKRTANARGANNVDTGIEMTNYYTVTLGYTHLISKRTSVFVDGVYGNISKLGMVATSSKIKGYSAGIRHTF